MVPAQRRPCQVVRDAWHFSLGLGVDFDIRAATSPNLRGQRKGREGKGESKVDWR